MRQKEINNDYLNKEQKINKEYELGIRKINMKEKSDKQYYDNERLKIQKQININDKQTSEFNIKKMENEFNIIKNKLEYQHKLDMDESKRKTQKLIDDNELIKNKMKKEIIDAKKS